MKFFAEYYALFNDCYGFYTDAKPHNPLTHIPWNYRRLHLPT